MEFIFSLIAEFLVVIIFEILLEGFGYLIRKIYYFIFPGSIAEVNRSYVKKEKLPGFNLSQNKQAGIVALIMVLITSTFLNLIINRPV
jgi:hypothetical protein